MGKRNYSECLGSRIRRVSRILDNSYRKLVSDYGISEHQLNILFFMCEVNEVDQGEIGKYLVLDRSTVSRNVKHLLDKGLVSRSSDYRPKIRITEKGKHLAKSIEPGWNKLMDELMGKIGEEGIASVEMLEQRLK